MTQILVQDCILTVFVIGFRKDLVVVMDFPYKQKMHRSVKHDKNILCDITTNELSLTYTLNKGSVLNTNLLKTRSIECV